MFLILIFLILWCYLELLDSGVGFTAVYIYQNLLNEKKNLLNGIL